MECLSSNLLCVKKVDLFYAAIGVRPLSIPRDYERSRREEISQCVARESEQNLRPEVNSFERKDLTLKRTFRACSNTYIDLKTPSSWRLLRTQFAFRDAGGGVNPTLKACSL